ncbi:MAG: hypothetical protein K2N36_07225 [Ruminiclostridium sp.]|nr:hypothetical protein [Ruminiclostridium sp.]
MQTESYIIVTHSNGKRKVYRTETYLLLRRLKFVGTILTAIAVTMLLCGATLADGSPTMPLEIVALLGIGLLVIILLICSYIKDSERQEKQDKRKKG